MSKVSVAATQMQCSWDIDDNVQRAESLIRKAAAKDSANHTHPGVVRNTLFLHRTGFQAPGPGDVGG